MNSRFKIRKNILLAVKIGVGTSLAISIAETLRLRYATSAGIITLLTLITTKRGTFRLAFQRLLSYGVSVATCVILFHLMKSRWMEYGIFLFFLVLWTEWLEWRGTLSVNAVIGTHFLAEQDFSFAFIRNFGSFPIIIAVILKCG